MTCYLAIDIGASSGRHILGWQEDGVMQDKEVYRFCNGVESVDGHLTWNLENLFREIKAGIREAFRVCPQIQSLSIDTWGVDYVLLKGDEEVLPCYAYRDRSSKSLLAICASPRRL